MGRYRFKLSDIMPNAWFYKLRDMTSTNPARSSKNPKPNKQKSPPPSISKHPKAPPPSSLTRDGPTYYNNINTPKKPPPQLYKIKHRTSSSSGYKSPRRQQQQQQLISYNSVNVSAASCTSCKSTTTSTMFMSYDQHELDHHQYSSSSTAANSKPNVKHGNWSGSSCCCCCRSVMDSTSSDIIIDMDHDQKVLLYSDIDIIQHHDQPCKVIREIEQLDIIPLKPILTKPNNKTKLVMDHQAVKVKVQVPPTSCLLRSRPSRSEMGYSVHGSRKKLVGSSGHGFDLPRKSISIKGSQQQQSRRRRSYSESFAVVKNSSNPRRDFKESMVEMIVENEIKGSKDLEDLLACYLSLNSDEYHDDIVKVFEQVWLELRRDSTSTVIKR